MFFPGCLSLSAVASADGVFLNPRWRSAQQSERRTQDSTLLESLVMYFCTAQRFDDDHLSTLKLRWIWLIFKKVNFAVNVITSQALNCSVCAVSIEYEEFLVYNLKLEESVRSVSLWEVMEKVWQTECAETRFRTWQRGIVTLYFIAVHIVGIKDKSNTPRTQHRKMKTSF